jgi:transposase
MKSEKFLLCGVDVGSKELVVALETSTGRVWEGVFGNDSAGHGKLIRRLTRTKATARVCVEATGIYHLDLCLALDQAERIQVMVANPRTTKDFARAQLRRSKTDRTDALSLLEFVRRMEFEVWAPPSRSILGLRALSRRMQALLVTRA